MIRLEEKSTPANIQFKVEVTIPGNSEWYLLPSGVLQINVDVLASGGAEAIVQTSNDVDGIINGTATPVDWDFGIVTSNKSAKCGSVRGIRLVSSVGSVSMFCTVVLK